MMIVNAHMQAKLSQPLNPADYADAAELNRELGITGYVGKHRPEPREDGSEDRSTAELREGVRVPGYLPAHRYSEIPREESRNG